MALAENPLNRSLRELPHVAHETLAWTGRHWKSVSLTAAAVLGGGYLLLAHDSNPQNLSIRPTTPASDKFNQLGAGLDTDIPVLETITNTVTAVSRTGCLRLQGTDELVEIIYNPATGSQQIPCSSEEVKILPTLTPFPVSGLEPFTPHSPYKNALEKVLNGGASDEDLGRFNALATENMEVSIWYKDGIEISVPKIPDLYSSLEVFVNKSGELESRVIYRNKQGKRTAILNKDRSVMWE